MVIGFITMNEEQELWLELYKFISDIKNEISMEITNDVYQSPSIKLSQYTLTPGWATLDNSWERGYIEGVGNNLKEQLQDVINKIKNNDWTYY